MASREQMLHVQGGSEMVTHLFVQCSFAKIDVQKNYAGSDIRRMPLQSKGGDHVIHG